MRGHRLLVCALACAAGAVLARPAAADFLNFELSARDALASVARYNAFVASLGKGAKGARILPGGTRFAGHDCADLGGDYRLGAVTVLEGPAALTDVVVSKKRRTDVPKLVNVFAAAAITPWSQAGAEFQTDIPFWTAGAAAKGLRFVADGLAPGTDDGLLRAPGGAGAMRFRIDVAGAPSVNGTYRFLLELHGRRSVFDTGRRAKVRERRCYTFVDLKPMVDFGTLAAMIGAIPALALRTALEAELAAIAAALTQSAPEATHEPIAHIVALAVQATPDPLAPPDAKRLVRTAFAFRRSLLFNPAAAVCGNGARESGEACDGADLGGFGCTQLGFESGTLTCTGFCRFDTAACVGKPVCGNGTLEPGEECDDGPANSNTLPDACRTTCRKAFCGDGVLDGFEDCEGSNLAGETCISLGYDGGRLRCDDECFFDDERCTISEN